MGDCSAAKTGTSAGRAVVMWGRLGGCSRRWFSTHCQASASLETNVLCSGELVISAVARSIRRMIVRSSVLFVTTTT